MSIDLLRAVLEDLRQRISGVRAALLLDRDGLLIAHATQDAGQEMESAAAGAGLLFRDTWTAAGRLGQGEIGEILLEGERMHVAMIPLKSACRLCLVLSPDAVLGRALFEARRAASALDVSL